MVHPDFVWKRRVLLLILFVALALRLLYGLSLSDAALFRESGGDSWWYLDHGLKLVENRVLGPPPSAPLYLVFVGLAQMVLPPPSALVFIRLAQAFMGVATCYFAFRLAQALADSERAGLLAAGALAISPAFVLESGQILTETLFLFLLAGALALYLERVKHEDAPASLSIILVGLLLGLATLTRAVLLLFPLGLMLHLLLVYRWRRGTALAALLLAVYLPVILIWTVYNKVVWDETVIGAQGFSAFLYLGASNNWQDPEKVDEQLAAEAGLDRVPDKPGDQQEIYSSAAAGAISSDPAGWLRGRFSDLAGAYLQPHGTIFFSGDSLKDLTARWWREDRTLGGLLLLTQGNNFWPKLTIYLFHYGGILFGLIGMWLTRKRWQVALPLVGYIVYTTLIHLVLDAIPRYIFPTTLFWWVFASVALVMLWDKLRSGREQHPAAASLTPESRG